MIVLALTTLAVSGASFFLIRFALRAHRWNAANGGTVLDYFRHALAEWIDGFEKLPAPSQRDEELDDDDTTIPQPIANDQTASPD